jgi:hypothetical protein
VWDTLLCYNNLMKSVERNNIPSYVALGLVLAAGAVALTKPNQTNRFLPHTPIPSEGRLTKYNGANAKATYFKDGTRDLSVFDQHGYAAFIYHERCKHLFLGGEFLQIDVVNAIYDPPKSAKDYEFYEGITELSPICDDGEITPKDFHGKEGAIDTVG